MDQGFIDMLAAPRLSVRQLPPNEDLRRELVAALREEGISWAAEVANNELVLGI